MATGPVFADWGYGQNVDNFCSGPEGDGSTPFADLGGDVGFASGAEGVIWETTHDCTGRSGPLPLPGYHALVEEIVVDCPACAEPFALEVDVAAEEQSHFLGCPSCARALEVFVRCRSGEVLSTSVSVD